MLDMRRLKRTRKVLYLGLLTVCGLTQVEPIISDTCDRRLRFPEPNGVHVGAELDIISGSAEGNA